MTISGLFSITLKDTKTGLPLSYRAFPSRSYVIAFLDILHAQFTGLSTSITDTTGNARAVAAHANNLSTKAGATVSTWGLVVGTGTNAVLITDTKLQTQIAHGVGAGQLYYQLVESIAPSTSGATRRFIFTRSFVNQSGGTITVRECGIYSSATATPYYFCTVRDLVPGGQDILNGQTLALQYTIGVTA